MKTMKRILFFVIAAISTATCLNAQQVGTWRTYFGYNININPDGTQLPIMAGVKQIAQTPNKIFALAASGALYSVDRRDESEELYSKVTGLNDTGISTIAYNEATKTLVIAYASSNIDLITDDGIFNLPDLLTKDYPGSKSINSIYMNGNFAYLACDFGIVVLNLARNKREFADTYLIGTGGTAVPVSSVTMSNDYIYAASGWNIYIALKSDRNLSNSDRWSIMTGMPQSTWNNKTLAYWSGKLYVLKVNGTAATGSVYSKTDGAGWNATAAWTGVYFIGAQTDRLLMSNNNTIRSYDTSHTFTTISTSPRIPLAVEYLTKESEYWIAGNTDGLINLTKNKVYDIKGPKSNDARKIYAAGDKIFVNTTGPWDVPSASGFIAGAIMMYSTTDKTWSNILKDNDRLAGNDRNYFCSLTGLVVNPQDNAHILVSSWFGGVYEFKNGIFTKRYNSSNSTIRDISGQISDNWHITYGATFDNDGNFWVINTLQPSNVVKILKNDGTWTELNYPYLVGNNTEKVDKIYIDSHNNKWVSIWRTMQSIFVFNENKTFDNPADDKTRIFDATNGFATQNDNNFFSIPRCFAEDKTGKMWIGTDSGPIVIENPATIFTSNSAIRPKISRNDGSDLADYLLDGIQINAIVVDGDNRKWIATNGYGIYLVSADGTSIIKHFNVDNSPLLLDNVNSLTLSETGELFIATDLGICSYQTDATETNITENPFENVYAFPNPVAENYDGVISIVGLQADSNVKITDINGNLVYETTSRGGMATWDGRNRNGQKVSTGIYLVDCANSEASKTGVTKIMIINR